LTFEEKKELENLRQEIGKYREREEASRNKKNLNNSSSDVFINFKLGW
jgi:hypothetical protein